MRDDVWRRKHQTIHFYHESLEVAENHCIFNQLVIFITCSIGSFITNSSRIMQM